MAIFGSLSTVRSQLAQTPAFQTALAYLAETLRDGSEPNRALRALKPGDISTRHLDNGVFAMEQAYIAKAPSDPAAKWESHKVHIDIQLLLQGTERMDVTETANLTVTEDGTPEKDYLFYAPFDNASTLRIAPGEAAVFFPSDAHKPALSTTTPPALHIKTCVKIPVAP